MASSKPVFLVCPGAAFTPAHYGHLFRLLTDAGYGAISAILLSKGSTRGAKFSVEEDVSHIRDRLILPILEDEERDVVIVGHSYSALPASAAVTGLGKSARKAAGKKTAVIGQIHIASVISKGGNGSSVATASGGKKPSDVGINNSAKPQRSEEPSTPPTGDINAGPGSAGSPSKTNPSSTSSQASALRASWDEEGYNGRLAYIKTTQDAAVPVQVQEMFIQASGTSWIVREIAAAHSPMLSKPEELAEMMIKFAEQFEAA